MSEVARARRSLFAMIILFLLADLILSGFDPRELVMRTAIRGVLLSQTALLAAWMVLGTDPGHQRALRLVLLMILAWLTTLIGQYLVPQWVAGWQDLGVQFVILRAVRLVPIGRAIQLAVDGMLLTVGSVAAIWAYRMLTKQVICFGEPKVRQVSKFRFSVRDLVVWMSLITVAFVLLAKLFDFESGGPWFGRWFFVQIPISFLLGVVISLCAEMTLRVRTRRFYSPLLILIILLMIVSVMIGRFISHSMPRVYGLSNPVIWREFLPFMGGFVTTTTLVLLTLRKAGFRLVKISDLAAASAENL